MTMSAGWPSVKLVALFHPSTRLLLVSTTYRWFGVLFRSTAIWLGPLRLDALVLFSPLWVRSISPSTLSAILSPLIIVIEAMTKTATTAMSVLMVNRSLKIVRGDFGAVGCLSI